MISNPGRVAARYLNVATRRTLRNFEAPGKALARGNVSALRSQVDSNAGDSVPSRQLEALPHEQQRGLGPPASRVNIRAGDGPAEPKRSVKPSEDIEQLVTTNTDSHGGQPNRLSPPTQAIPVRTSNGQSGKNFGSGEDLGELAAKLKRILDDEARRHGIDV